MMNGVEPRRVAIFNQPPAMHKTKTNTAKSILKSCSVEQLSQTNESHQMNGKRSVTFNTETENIPRDWLGEFIENGTYCRPSLLHLALRDIEIDINDEESTDEPDSANLSSKTLEIQGDSSSDPISDSTFRRYRGSFATDPNFQPEVSKATDSVIANANTTGSEYKRPQGIIIKKKLTIGTPPTQKPIIEKNKNINNINQRTDFKKDCSQGSTVPRKTMETNYTQENNVVDHDEKLINLKDIRNMFEAGKTRKEPIPPVVRPRSKSPQREMSNIGKERKVSLHQEKEEKGEFVWTSTEESPKLQHVSKEPRTSVDLDSSGSAKSLIQMWKDKTEPTSPRSGPKVEPKRSRPNSVVVNDNMNNSDEKISTENSNITNKSFGEAMFSVDAREVEKPKVISQEKKEKQEENYSTDGRSKYFANQLGSMLSIGSKENLLMDSSYNKNQNQKPEREVVLRQSFASDTKDFNGARDVLDSTLKRRSYISITPESKSTSETTKQRNPSQENNRTMQASNLQGQSWVSPVRDYPMQTEDMVNTEDQTKVPLQQANSSPRNTSNKDTRRESKDWYRTMRPDYPDNIDHVTNSNINGTPTNNQYALTQQQPDVIANHSIKKTRSPSMDGLIMSSTDRQQSHTNGQREEKKQPDTLSRVAPWSQVIDHRNEDRNTNSDMLHHGEGTLVQQQQQQQQQHSRSPQQERPQFQAELLQTHQNNTQRDKSPSRQPAQSKGTEKRVGNLVIAPVERNKFIGKLTLPNAFQ